MPASASSSAAGSPSACVQHHCDARQRERSGETGHDIGARKRFRRDQCALGSRRRDRLTQRCKVFTDGDRHLSLVCSLPAQLDTLDRITRAQPRAPAFDRQCEGEDAHWARRV